MPLPGLHSSHGIQPQLKVCSLRIPTTSSPVLAFRLLLESGVPGFLNWTDLVLSPVPLKAACTVSVQTLPALLAETLLLEPSSRLCIIPILPIHPGPSPAPLLPGSPSFLFASSWDVLTSNSDGAL